MLAMRMYYCTYIFSPFFLNIILQGNFSEVLSEYIALLSQILITILKILFYRVIDFCSL